jgi:hypothetical protein
MEATDPAVKQLATIAFDENAPVQTRLKASIAIIDRGGLGPQTAVDVSVTARPYEQIFDLETMESGGSRAEHRRSMGEDDSVTEAIGSTDDDQHALGLEAAEDDLIVDAEVLGDEPDAREFAARMTHSPRHIDADPMTSDDDERGSAFDSAPKFNPFARTPPPEAGLMPFDAAVSAAAEMRRSAVLRQAQRALPPGRSR